METIEVAAGLIFRDGKLLIAQRLEGDHLGGMWEFPGGKREAGETYEACLKRELLEELSVAVEVQGMIEEIFHSYPDRRVCLRFFRCRLLRNEPKPLGCQALVWVSAEELASYSFPAADELLLARLRATPELWR